MTSQARFVDVSKPLPEDAWLRQLCRVADDKTLDQYHQRFTQMAHGRGEDRRYGRLMLKVMDEEETKRASEDVMMKFMQEATIVAHEIQHKDGTTSKLI